jgi:hypothetical protein
MRYASFLPQAELRAKSLYNFTAYHEKLCGKWDECMSSELASTMTTISEKDINGLLATTRLDDILHCFGMVKTGTTNPTITTWRTSCGMEFVCYFSVSEEGARMIDRIPLKQSNPAVILGDIEWE